MGDGSRDRRAPAGIVAHSVGAGGGRRHRGGDTRRRHAARGRRHGRRGRRCAVDSGSRDCGRGISSSSGRGQDVHVAGVHGGVAYAGGHGGPGGGGKGGRARRRGVGVTRGRGAIARAIRGMMTVGHDVQDVLLLAVCHFAVCSAAIVCSAMDVLSWMGRRCRERQGCQGRLWVCSSYAACVRLVNGYPYVYVVGGKKEERREKRGREEKRGRSRWKEAGGARMTKRGSLLGGGGRSENEARRGRAEARPRPDTEKGQNGGERIGW